MYLELVYEDLLASAGVTLPPCSSDSTSSSTSSSGIRGSSASDSTNDNEGDAIVYCQGYNLVMTSQVHNYCQLPNPSPRVSLVINLVSHDLTGNWLSLSNCVLSIFLTPSLSHTNLPLT